MQSHSPPASALTELILTIFRLNGRLLAAGDRLAEPLGLTSARWQVLGAVAIAAAPQPVANLARTMGLTRQAVQRIVNELEGEEFLTFEDNPHHQRAKLVVLTKKGRQAYDAIDRVQVRWANALAKGFTAKALSSAVDILTTLTQRLEEDQEEV